MKLSNFFITDIYKDSSGVYSFGEIDVTTGFWMWKKTKTKKIARTPFGSWHFVDAGEYVPMIEMYKFERAYDSQRILIKMEKPQ